MSEQPPDCQHEWMMHGVRMPEGYVKPVSSPVCKKCGAEMPRPTVYTTTFPRVALEAENAQLRAERNDFYESYRRTCDVETRALEDTIQRLRADLARVQQEVQETKHIAEIAAALLVSQEADIQQLTQERDEARARAIVAEHHKVLSLMGRSSWAEVVEDKLRIELAETQIAKDQAEAQLTALTARVQAVSNKMAASRAPAFEWIEVLNGALTEDPK